jgi:hypothetical protein
VSHIIDKIVIKNCKLNIIVKEDKARTSDSMDFAKMEETLSENCNHSQLLDESFMFSSFNYSYCYFGTEYDMNHSSSDDQSFNSE